jgi:glycosyltransferase involved in cell wall biosynthesis
MDGGRGGGPFRLMKILWVKSDFLHPTERGGQIRTLETLRQLHRRHEIHYVAFDNPARPEGPARAHEYCSYAYPIRLDVPLRGSAEFWLQVAASPFSRMPLSITRYRSQQMRDKVTALLIGHDFGAIVCDFLTPAQNLPRLDQWVLFQHNVETMIWRRQAATARGVAQRLFFRLEAARLFRHERDVCRTVKKIVTVSEEDRKTTADLFGVTNNVTAVPTGVDCEYFARPKTVEPFCDLVFLGSMDWMPNIDGVQYFVREVWPSLRASHPECSLGVVGRTPPREILRLAEDDERIKVTGTVPDVRPYLWGSRVSIVPLRIGGGSRLKIYEAMAAGVPVVSTSIGAEGLPVEHPTHIRLADTPEAFADQCRQLLASETERQNMAAAAQAWVAANSSWETVAVCFEGIIAG